MPSPRLEVQIENYLNSPEIQRAYTWAQIDSLRTTLSEWADRAERGDTEARAELESIGISFAAVPQLPWDVQTPVRAGAGTEVPAGGITEIAPGLYVYTDPVTGERWEANPSTNLYGNQTFALGSKIGGGAEATTGLPSTTIRDYQYLIAEAEAAGDTELAAAYRNALQAEYLGTAGGTAAITPYQSAQLNLSSQRLGLDWWQAQEQAQRLRLTEQIQAARAGEPLTYLSLLRRTTPSPTGEIYQGLNRVVPALPAQTQLATSQFGTAATAGTTAAGGWEAPPMPPAMATIQRGEPLGVASLPAGTLRAPGVQAQANLTPTEQIAQLEAVEFQGVPSRDYEELMARLRRGMGGGLRAPSYAGTLRA